MDGRARSVGARIRGRRDSARLGENSRSLDGAGVSLRADGGGVALGRDSLPTVPASHCVGVGRGVRDVCPDPHALAIRAAPGRRTDVALAGSEPVARASRSRRSRWRGWRGSPPMLHRCGPVWVSGGRTVASARRHARMVAVCGVRLDSESSPARLRARPASGRRTLWTGSPRQTLGPAPCGDAPWLRGLAMLGGGPMRSATLPLQVPSASAHWRRGAGVMSPALYPAGLPPIVPRTLDAFRAPLSVSAGVLPSIEAVGARCLRRPADPGPDLMCSAGRVGVCARSRRAST